ncbi:disease resistance-like protein DSC1 isoform X2 [Quercus robur]|uniref:disease resistance-like protein DSC1 isoform X2 n=1 Tax=Quercus robur TaxID=38942 RepID=UPI00216208A9|nr:disease resistance-like protein DSC1 isoform X2 [Quercus robur]
MEVVEGIVLNTPNQKEEHLNSKAFSKMKKLRLLKVNNVEPPKGLLRGNVQLPQGLSHLPDELRVIEWHGYPLNSLPTNFQPNKLVELRMHCSHIKQLWKGIMNLDELKFIDLSDSQTLIEIPDLSGAPNLKKLILRRCTRLYKIHASLGNLKRLIQLDLNGCKCLESLPHKINLEALEILDLGGCSRLNKFPKIMGNMPHLLKLNLSETAIKDLSFLVEHSIGHIKLDLRHGKNLSSLPDTTCSLSSLKTLTLSGCSKLSELPENLGNIKGLEKLDVNRTAIRRLPSSIVLLKNLRKLSLSGCEGLSSKSLNKLLSFPLMQPRRSPDSMGLLVHTLSGIRSLTKLDLSYCKIRAIPYDISCLSTLRTLNLRGNNFDCLPESIIQLSNLIYLFMGGCTNLRLLPELPSNIEYIDAEGCISLETLPARPEDNFLCLRLFNCVKMIDNEGYDNLFLTMLRHDLFKIMIGFVSLFLKIIFQNGLAIKVRGLH